MSTSVGLIGPGRMGSAIARRLIAHGADVRADLFGRGTETARRARDAGIRETDAAGVVSADMVLSIVPPAQAMNAATWFAGAVTPGDVPPYIDLNAINPATAAAVEAVVAGAGAAFIDGCIVGMEPREGYDGPWIHLSGPHQDHVQGLGELGLNIERLDGPNGAASALKMSFAAIMKGLQALGCASVLAASHAGAGPALRRELARREPELTAWLDRRIARMYPKTYRWVAEMEELADFAGPARGGAIFAGAAELFAGLSDDGPEAAALLAVLQDAFPPSTGDAG